MTTLTVVAADKVMIVDGEVLNNDYVFPSNLWAIQWNGSTGEAEWTDGPNTSVTIGFVQPYIDQWQAVKDAQAVTADPESERTDAEILNNALSDAKIAITDRCTAIRAMLVGNADSNKVAGYVDKAAIAKRVIAKTADADDLLAVETEATERGQGESVQELAKIHNTKAKALSIARATIDGMESAALNALEKCTTAEQISAQLAQWGEKTKATLSALTGSS